METELEVLKLELNELRKNSPTKQNEIRIKLDQIGRKYQKIKKYNEALACFKECLEIEKQILPSNHKNIALSLNLIGSLYEDLGQLENALKYLNESLDISKKILPSNDLSIANTLNDCGIIYQKQCKMEEALKCYNQSLEIYKQNYPENHISIANSLNNIGTLYKNNGKSEEALKFYKQSLEIKKQVLPENHPLIAETLNNTGSVYYNQGKFEEALRYYNQSVEMKKKTLSENDISIADTLNNIGVIYRNQKKIEEGLKFLNKALEIYNKKLPPTHFSIAETIFNIGSIYLDKENYEEALKYFYQALEILKLTFQENHPSIIRTRNAIGSIYFNQGKYVEALNYLRDGRTRKECIKKIDEESKQNIHSLKNLQITDQESKINYLGNDLKIRKVKSQISKGNIALQTYIEGINADVLIGRVIDEKYKIYKYLGRGGYGKVYTVLDILDNNNIKVIKLIKKSNNNDEWATEASLLRRLEHNNIVKYHDHFDLISKESSSYPCIITEYCENGDLASRILKAKSKEEKFEDKIISNWMFQASDGLQYLHIMTVIHRDIKPQNILLTREDMIKLADLGTAKVMQEYSASDTVTGTAIYRSPEMQACLSSITGLVYSYPTDIWSLGCVLYELVFLEFAYKNIGKDHPFGGSPNFSGYIKKMLAQNPDDRITAKNLYEEFKKLKERLH